MKILSLITVLFLIGCSSGQIKRIDVPNKSRQNYLAVEGGPVPVKIDTVTPLNDIIKRLDSNWEFEETGKGYWIGYTNDMFSIAAHKDNSIIPLVKHYYSTTSEKGKVGVIYSLHLIGIESKIVGRFKEKFINMNARQALLNLAKDKKYTSIVVTLLARDPWKSDLQALYELLKKDSNNSQLINVLFRYPIDDIPFRQNIPESLDTINVYINDSTGITNIGRLITTFKEKDFDSIDIEKGNNIRNAVGQSSKKGYYRIFRRFYPNKDISKIVSYFNCEKSLLKKGTCAELNHLLYYLIYLSGEKVDVFSYCYSDDMFSHYFEKNNLVICTRQTTRQRWLNYFKTKAL